MTAYYLESQLTYGTDGLVIDIKGAGNVPFKKEHSELDVYRALGQDNQAWTQEPSTTSPGWYTLQSNLTDLESGYPLVIDITGAGNDPIEAGAKLGVWTPTGNDNQLWQFVEVEGWYVIQSKLTDVYGNPLVIDIYKSDSTPGAVQLQVWTQNNGSNQLWQQAGWPT